MPLTHSVTVEIGIKAGSRYEPNDSFGLAHFSEHMLFEGSMRFPTSSSLSNFIEKNGGKGWAVTDKECVTYAARVQPKNLSSAFVYLHELLFKPLLLKGYIKKEKKIIIEEQRSRTDNITEYIWDLWFKHAWGTYHPLGRLNTGDEKSVNMISHKKLLWYIKNYYLPQNMVLIVCGNFSYDKAEYYIRKFFDFKADNFSDFNQTTGIEINPNEVGNKIKIIRTDSQQVQFILGFITGVSLKHNDRYALRLAGDILGDGSSSRLFRRLLYDKALAYYINVDSWPFSDTGVFCINGAFSPRNTARVIRLILEEIHRLKLNLVPLLELSMAREKDKSTVMFSCEATDVMADYLTKQILLEKRLLTLKQLVQEFNKVGPQDVQRVIKKYLTVGAFRTILVGPLDENILVDLNKSLKIL